MPVVGRSRPAKIPSRVDLPDPEGPTIARVSPAGHRLRLICCKIAERTLGGGDLFTDIADFDHCKYPLRLKMPTLVQFRLFDVTT